MKPEEMETLDVRDRELEKLWSQLEHIPVDPKTKQIKASYLHFPPGTPRVDIWCWFNERYSKGTAFLIVKEDLSGTAEMSKLYLLRQKCFECESKDCAFNHDGECRFALAHERKPKMTEDDGCLEFVIT